VELGRVPKGDISEAITPASQTLPLSLRGQKLLLAEKGGRVKSKQRRKLGYLDLQVRVDTGNWTETAIIRPDPNMSYGQYFLQIQTKVNELVHLLNESTPTKEGGKK